MKNFATLVLTALATASFCEIHTPLGMLGMMAAGAGFGVIILTSTSNDKMYY